MSSFYNNLSLKELLEYWVLCQHHGEYEDCDFIEKIIKNDYNINMKEDWEKYLHQYYIIE